MSYKVKFWSLSKRSNSTLTPTTGATEYDCIVKNGTGILHPKIELDLGLTTDPSAFNYCYIANFDRYYYVNEWTFDRGLWTAVCNVDVLTTYKSQIGSTSMYVLRASASYNGDIVDNLYPTKSGCSYDHTTMSSPYLTSGGTFIVGAIAPTGDYGSVTYTAVNQAGLATLCSYLTNSAVSVANNFDLTDASMALQASLVDPLQYIKSCMWFPFAMTDFSLQTATTSFDIFMWNVPSVLNSRISANKVSKSYTLNLKKHPDTVSRGNYVNTSPYTILTLYVAPFGVIELDSTVTCNATSITLELNVDPITGRGILRILCHGSVLHQLEAQIGVPIQLSQVTRDYVGAISSVAGAVGGALGGLAIGNMAGAVSSAISGIGSAVNSLRPRSQTMGSGGGFTAIDAYTWTLDHQFFRPVDDDITHNGRPYCQVTTPSSLGGYMLIQDGDVAIPGTREEADQIRALLEGGFYYE